MYINLSTLAVIQMTIFFRLLGRSLHHSTTPEQRHQDFFALDCRQSKYI